MADFDLSGVVRLDGSEAASGASQVASSLEDVASATKDVGTASSDMAAKTGAAASALDKVGQSAKTATTGAKTLAEAEAQAATAADALAQAETNLARDAAAGGLNRIATARAVAQAQLQVAAASVAVEREQAKLNATTNAFSAEANRAAFGARNLGQQVGDFATQVSLGDGVIRAFSSQVGQAGFAMSEMGGKLGAVGKFLVGPWGIALTVAALALGPLLEKMLDAGKASEELDKQLSAATQAADSFGNAQSLLGKIIDLTTGKLKTQNTVLIESVRLQAAVGLARAKLAEQDARDDIGNIGKTSLGQSIAIGLAGLSGDPQAGGAQNQANSAAAAAAYNAPFQALSARVLSGQLTDPTAIRKNIEDIGKAAKLSTDEVAQLQLKIFPLLNAKNDQKANQEVLDAIDTGKISPDLVPYERAKKPKKPKKIPDTTAFVAGVQQDIASIIAQFTDAPTFIEKARAAVAKLDKDIAELAKKKPPNFQSLIDQATAAKGIIQDNIAKPYDDFIKGQERAFEVQQLLTAGRIDEANALKQVQALQLQMGPLTDKQKDGVLATVQALRAEQKEADVVKEKAQKYLDTLADIKTTAQGAVTDVLSGQFGALKDIPGQLIKTFQSLEGKVVFEKLFGNIFRDLQDQINGTSVVKDASDRMAEAVNSTVRPLNDLAAAAQAAKDGISAKDGTAIPGAGGLPGGAAGSAGGSTVDSNGDIVVTAPRYPTSASGFTGLVLNKIVSAIAPKLGLGNIDLGGLVKDAAFGSLGNSLVGGSGAASGIGSALGGIVGQKALGSVLGSGLSAISSSLGSLGGPLGSIIGGVAGSLLGSVFSPKTTQQAVTLDNGNASYYNYRSSNNETSQIASSITDGIAKIASALGGTASTNYKLSVGLENGTYRVSGDGGNVVGDNIGALKYQGTDAQAALSAALADAVGDGAVQGISDAMKRALAASPDIDTAIAEALKVKDVEAAIAGIGDNLKASFDALDAAAADRVATATKYGIDLVAVEKLNDQQRADLVNSTLKSSIGSLADFLTSVQYGDLFEGSASDRRAAILKQIDAVKGDAEAGKDGAADQLQTLLTQLLSTSKEAFGTAGVQYASDRADALTEVQKVIQMETDRISAASGLTNDQLAATLASNNLLSEANDLTAVTNARLATIAAAMGATVGTNASVDTTLTAR